MTDTLKCIVEYDGNVEPRGKRKTNDGKQFDCVDVKSFALMFKGALLADPFSPLTGVSTTVLFTNHGV